MVECLDLLNAVPTMADYRLYVHDAQGHIRRAIEIIADSDSDAIDAARDNLKGGGGELWNLARKVMEFRVGSRGSSGSPGSPDPSASA